MAHKKPTASDLAERVVTMLELYQYPADVLERVLLWLQTDEVTQKIVALIIENRYPEPLLRRIQKELDDAAVFHRISKALENGD